MKGRSEEKTYKIARDFATTKKETYRLKFRLDGPWESKFDILRCVGFESLEFLKPLLGMTTTKVKRSMLLRFGSLRQRHKLRKCFYSSQSLSIILRSRQRLLMA